jgi:cytochrome P450
LRTLHKGYGNAVAFLKGPSCSIFAFGPDFNRAVLTNPDAYHLTSGFPGPRNSAQRRFGRGLFGLNGEAHQRHRRLLMPPFRKEAVESYRDLLSQLTEQFLAGWQPGLELDMARALKEFSLRVTSKVLFGVEDFGVAQAIEGAFDEWVELNHATFFAAFLPIDCPDGCYEKLLEAGERLEPLLLELVRQKRAARADGNDVLTLLLQLRDAGELCDADVVGHMHTLFNAAYHTSTAALTWTVFLLAQHPRAMRQLVDELDGTLAGDAPLPAQLGRLPVLDRVIKESLRLLPPVVYSPRVSLRPVHVGSYYLPRGTMVVASHYITHHLPEIYPEPERFMPDRWLGEAPSPYAYLPFGAGPRMCIGTPFAVLFLKVSLALICQRFRLTVVPGACIDRHSNLTLGPRTAVPMRIWRQDRRFSTSAVRGDIHDLVQFPPSEGAAVAA